MSDLEQGIRRALRGMLDPIEPPPSLHERCDELGSDARSTRPFPARSHCWS
jgi:hypothetical protein